MPTKHGTMATARPERYAKQLVGHWSARGPVERFAEVVARHLERFGQRDELDVVWSD